MPSAHIHLSENCGASERTTSGRGYSEISDKRWDCPGLERGCKLTMGLLGEPKQLIPGAGGNEDNLNQSANRNPQFNQDRPTRITSNDEGTE
jgi:hypothetical protein